MTIFGRYKHPIRYRNIKDRDKRIKKQNQTVEQDYRNLKNVSNILFTDKRSCYRISLQNAFKKTANRLEKKYNFTFKSEFWENYTKEFLDKFYTGNIMSEATNIKIAEILKNNTGVIK